MVKFTELTDADMLDMVTEELGDMTESQLTGLLGRIQDDNGSDIEYIKQCMLLGEVVSSGNYQKLLAAKPGFFEERIVEAIPGTKIVLDANKKPKEVAFTDYMLKNPLFSDFCYEGVSEKMMLKYATMPEEDLATLMEAEEKATDYEGVVALIAVEELLIRKNQMDKKLFTLRTLEAAVQTSSATVKKMEADARKKFKALKIAQIKVHLAKLSHKRCKSKKSDYMSLHLTAEGSFAFK